jgi:hypothetical protein
VRRDKFFMRAKHLAIGKADAQRPHSGGLRVENLVNVCGKKPSKSAPEILLCVCVNVLFRS